MSFLGFPSVASSRIKSLKPIQDSLSFLESLVQAFSLRSRSGALLLSLPKESQVSLFRNVCKSARQLKFFEVLRVLEIA